MESLSLASALPFAALVLGIAVLPLAAGRWWEHNRNKALYSGALALPFAAWLIGAHGSEGAEHLLHASLDYLSFIALIGALFVISGGIHVRGSLSGTPLANSALLAAGAVLANLIGTTGASMVLIRPLLRANQRRRRRAHLVLFFILIVSNSAGLLTPLGDPPLFLGFLKGVPFFWTLGLWRQWLLLVGYLLLLFNLVDQALLARDEAAGPQPLLEEVLQHQPLRVEGGLNLLFLGGVVLAILGKGYGWFNGGASWPFGVQEALLGGLAAASYRCTRKEVHQANRFHWEPLVEVAVLFAGVFLTMTAPILLLNESGGSLGLTRPWHYFWATGSLSGVLDNAPTYLAFAASAAGQMGVPATGDRYLSELLATGPRAGELLAAISCGAVMMGANTYIGNGPNFMVRAIAEHDGVKMPSFFGYLVCAVAILVPAFVALSLIFFR